MEKPTSWPPPHHTHTPSSSSRMCVMNHSWSATKQRLHPQSVAEISDSHKSWQRWLRLVFRVVLMTDVLLQLDHVSGTTYLPVCETRKSAAQNLENNWKHSCFRRTAAHRDLFDYCAYLLNNNNNNNNNNNIRDNVYDAVIMAEPLREFTRFIWWM